MHGLALMMGRLVVLGPFCGLSSKQAQVFICRTFFDGSCRLGSFIRALLGHPVLWANAYKLGLS